MKSSGNAEKQEIQDDVWQLVKFRIMQSMPATAKLAIGEMGAFSKDDLIDHLNRKDEIGESIVKMQLAMLRYLAKS